MARYRDIVNNLKELYFVRVSSRVKIDNTDLRENIITPEYIHDKLHVDLAEELKPFVRKFVSDDPRTMSTIYESDIFIIVDPSAFFKQLNDELEGAYQYGLKTGKEMSEIRKIVNEANNGR